MKIRFMCTQCDYTEEKEAGSLFEFEGQCCPECASTNFYIRSIEKDAD